MSPELTLSLTCDNWYLELRNLAFVILGNTLCVTWEWRGYIVDNAGDLPMDGVDYGVSANIDEGTIEVSDTVGFDQDIRTFGRAADRGMSIELYGIPATPGAAGDRAVPGNAAGRRFHAGLRRTGRRDAGRVGSLCGADPHFRNRTGLRHGGASGHILARRLSDKVHLTADGPSRLGFDGDCFVEAIQTTIRPTGELTQTLWIEEAPPPEAPHGRPHGLHCDPQQRDAGNPGMGRRNNRRSPVQRLPGRRGQ